MLKELGIDPDGRNGDRGLEQDRSARATRERERLTNLARRKTPQPLLVSALTGEGVDAIKHLIETRIADTRTTFEMSLDPADGAGASWLYRNAEVLEKSMSDDGHLAMTVRVDPAKAGMLTAKFANARVTQVRHAAALDSASFSARLAASHNASISASVASVGLRCSFASACSIDAKRRSNFGLVSRSAALGDRRRDGGRD